MFGTQDVSDIETQLTYLHTHICRPAGLIIVALTWYPNVGSVTLTGGDLWCPED